MTTKTLIEILLIAVALSLDAFAVAISCGMKLPKNGHKKYLKIALAFGFAQALMPLIGALTTNFFLGKFLSRYADWIAFAIFASLSAKTLYDAYKASGEVEACGPCSCQNPKCLTSLTIATSIDALLIGAVLGLTRKTLSLDLAIIGTITFSISLLGAYIGSRSAVLFQNKARFVAGFILLFLAVKSLF